MNIAIYGTGGAGREVYELLESCDTIRKQWDEIWFIDDTKERGSFLDCKMLPFDDFIIESSPNDCKIYIAQGEPRARKILYERIKMQGYALATIIHPLAIVSPRAVIGEGVLVQDYVDVSSNAVIGNNVCINGHSIVGHDVRIGDNCQIASLTIIGGCTQIGDNTYVGMSACIRDHIAVGNDVIVSMGAVVVKSVNSERIVMGNPAREIAINKDGKVF